MTPRDQATKALAEVGAVLDAALPDQLDAALPPLQAAERIALYGVGREGLMMKALAMRLYHLGLDAHVVGDMTTPPLGAGDLLVVSAGPGTFATVIALMETTRAAGASTMCITAEPGGAAPKMADHIIHLPAQTMANDQNGAMSILPMGSLYEAAQFMFFELLILALRDRAGIDPDAMRHRHTNLE